MPAKHKQPKLLMAPGWAAPEGSDMFEDYIANSDKLWIYHEIHPVQNPKGVIFMMHGLAEHSGRYKHVIRHLNAAGFVCVMHDHQGHGRSHGERSHVESFDSYVDDFLLVMATVLKRNPSFTALPRFLLGHSMGGLIACLAVAEMKRRGLDKELSGMIITCPLLAADPKVATPFLKKVAKQFSACIPKFYIFWDKGPPAICRVSHSDATQFRFETDPQFARGMRVGLAYHILCAIDQVQAEAKEFSLPYLAFHAEEDGFCPIAGTEKGLQKHGTLLWITQHLILYFLTQWHANTSSGDKTYVCVEGAYHEILQEEDSIRKKVLGDISAWLAKHTSSRAPSRSNIRVGVVAQMGFPGGFPPRHPIPGFSPYQYGGMGAYGQRMV